MRSIALTLAVLFAPLTAQAGEAVTYDLGGESFEVYRAAASGGSKGLVIIIHDWDGLTDYEKKRAEMLAEMGFDAFAVDLYARATARSRQAPRKRRPASFMKIANGCGR
jgi:dienelactone hydrolase